MAKKSAPRLSDSYAEARTKFWNAATAANFSITSHVHPLKGPDGGELATDVATFIPPGATKVIVITSGVHGVEGYLGSALQTKALEDGLFENLPRDTGVVLVHALNPWGMAYFTRTNEDNVDLNRNFLVNWAEGAPADHPLAAEVHRIFVAPWDDKDAQRAAQAEFMKQHSLKDLQDAVSQGQYTNQQGLFCGGTGPTWSYKVWRERIIPSLRQYLPQVSGKPGGILHLDIHTGLAPRGEREMIGNHFPDSPAYKLAQRVWGKDAIKSTVTGNSSSSFLRGTIGETLQVPGVVSATMEIGTIPVLDVLQSLVVSNMAHPKGFDNQGLMKTAIAMMKAAFAPEDPAWARSGIKHGMRTIRQAISGIAKIFPSPGPAPQPVPPQKPQS